MTEEIKIDENIKEIKIDENKEEEKKEENIKEIKTEKEEIKIENKMEEEIKIEEKKEEIKIEEKIKEEKDDRKDVLYQEILYEVQMRDSIWKSFNDFPSVFVTTNFEKKNRNEVVLPDGWRWLSDWKTDGNDSWEYNTKWRDVGWNSSEGSFDYVRRIKYRKSRVSKLNDEEIKQLNYKVFTINKDTDYHKELYKMKENVKVTIESLSKKTLKPNILLLGGSGAGKSSTKHTLIKRFSKCSFWKNFSRNRRRKAYHTNLFQILRRIKSSSGV
jgi:flagellar biosynthesis GTPase FlhF